ncbi:metallophosphoesterase [Candidatus Pacearchaeota archaeon]|nr:metallophosphoesterase [Candidatus Pacearchaeota archaeon]
MNEEILKTIKERGLLLEKEIFDLLQNFNDDKSARAFLENLERISGQKVITRSLVNKNFEFLQREVSKLGGEDKMIVENLFVKLGMSLEVRKESSTIRDITDQGIEKKAKQSFQIFYADTKNNRKLEVGDFISNFRARYQYLQGILMQRPDLTNLVSINKISGERQSLSIIGMVTEKRITKNKNIIITMEDLTGSISILVKSDKVEIFEKAEELLLDDIIAVKANGNRDLLFVHEIYFPDAFVNQKAKFNEDISIAFLSDIHCGSKKHLARSFEKLLSWLNSHDENARKIRYLFFSGDNVDGVGIFPGQEHFLELRSMKEQYTLLAYYLSKIPRHITMFMCPGQHDATRVAEPQPIIDRKYSEPLYHIDNLILVTNPALIKLKEGENEFKVLMYHGASIHNFINEIKDLREIKAHRCPAKAVKHMLKRRHLAPTHSSAIYIPGAEKDPLLIDEVPDIVCTGEVHRLDIDSYNGILIITGSCWQAQTEFEEKVGNIPDPAKLPVLNLKNRELKVFDFTDEEEKKIVKEEKIVNEENEEEEIGGEGNGD